MFKSVKFKTIGLVVMAVLASMLMPAVQGGVLDVVPADAMVCVRINNLDTSLGMMDQFIAGASPMPMGLTMLARMQLAGVLGDPTLNNVNTGGEFAFFLTAKNGGDGEPEVFTGLLVPITDYKKFVDENPNCGTADAKGVSKISPPNQNGGPQMLIAKAGDFALLGEQSDYEKFVAALGSMKGKGVAAGLTGTQKEASKNSPIWVHVNVQQASKVFAPMVDGFIEQGKAELANDPGAPPVEILDFYSEMIDMIFREISSISISVSPKAEVLNAVFNLSAVPGTDMATFLKGDPAATKDKTLMRYMRDGSMMTMVCTLDSSQYRDSHVKMVELFGKMSNGANEEEMAELKKLTMESLDAAEGPFVFSMKLGEGSSPFIIEEIFRVKDEKTYKRVQLDTMKLLSEGVIGDFYRKFGINMDWTSGDAAEYKGIEISKGRLGLKAIDPQGEFGNAIDAVYGGGFDMSWAVFDKMCVYTMGDNNEAATKKLIDEVKAGGPKQMSAEIQDSIAHLKSPDNADVIGTFNLVRMIGMGSMITKNLGAPMPSVDATSSSNIAFAGYSESDGSASFEIAFPKAHLMEIVNMMQMMQQKQMEQMQQMQQ